MKILQILKFCLEELRAVDGGDIPWSKQELYETWRSQRKAAQEQSCLIADLRAQVASLTEQVELLQSQLSATRQSRIERQSGSATAAPRRANLSIDQG